MTHLALSALVTILRRALAAVGMGALHGAWLGLTGVLWGFDWWVNGVPG